MPKHLNWYKNQQKKRAYRNKQRKTNYDAGGFVGQKRLHWSRYEVETMLQSLATDRELAQLLKRSVRGIQIKRMRLNLGYQQIPH